jgi:zona occludens toxin
MVLTTPNIDRLRKDVRQVAEGAYKHKNQALIGIKGRYLEAFHMADDSGKSASDFLTLRMRKIRKEVWQLYESTATGTHSDTIAGLSLFSNPRVLLLLGALALAVTWFVGHGPPAVLGGGAKHVGDAVGAATGEAASVVGLSASPTPSRDSGGTPADNIQSRPASFFDGIRLYLKGRYGLVDSPRYLFQAEADKGGTWHITDEEITRAGGQIVALGDCAVKIVFRGDVRLVNCRAEREADGAKLKSLF